ncbi:MAG: DUF934 domain-containing protein [Alphaproteobacteria bacterium]
MTEVWKDGAITSDEWVMVSANEPIPADRPAFVPLQRWRAERDQVSSRNGAIGLLLEPDSIWNDIVDDLPRFTAIAITFPKHADGRGFSIARLLRDRDGYGGEIRAVGNYFVDQMPYLRRVGFDAFAVSDPKLRDALKRGVWPEVPFYLQPAEGDREVREGTRPWARRPGD